MTWGGMSGKGSRPTAGQGADPKRGNGGGGQESAGWTLFSYLIAGMVVYGGIGWLIAHWTRHPLIFPIGMLFGLAVAVATIIYRYGRS
jgi:ATP synthase protein I